MGASYLALLASKYRGDNQERSVERDKEKNTALQPENLKGKDQLDVNKTGFERPAQVLGSSGKRSSISFCIHLKVGNVLHIGIPLTLISADRFC